MKNINAEHPEYVAQREAWQTYRDLYAGGEQFRTGAERYLVPRQKEPADVYQERLDRVYYENYVGSIIDWYAATLFRREPLLIYEGNDETGRQFFNRMSEDCDLCGSSVSDFFRRMLTDALVAGRSYALVDFPRSAGQAGSRAEEEALGISRAYLTPYGAESLINWSRDDKGEFDWVVLRSERLVSPPDDPTAWRKLRTWAYYDRSNFEVYQQLEGAKKDEAPVLTDAGRHGLASIGRTPLFEMKVSDGLALMSKAASLQLEHFNKSNALGWSLTMGLFAMPVVYSERPWNQVVGESYFIQLGPQDRFGWTEPEGHVYEVALTNLDRLKEEIYRVCYLLSQAGGALSKNATLSGLSKQRDYAVTQEVLRAYGDTTKDLIKKIFRAVAEARQDRIAVDVSGLDEFDVGDFSAELADAKEVLSLGIESETLRKQVLKKVALKYLCDLRQEVKDRIAQEIDNAG
jgi:hypothetical protein